MAKTSMKSGFLVALCCLFAATVFSQTPYIKKYRPIADSLSREYGIPSSVMLGVAIIESGNGTSRNAKLLNNHFGIVGKNKLKGTKSRYKQYDSVLDSYVAFCKLLKKKKYYDKLKGNMNYALWLEAMSKANYSEVPLIWKQRVTSAIKKNKLATAR